MNCPRCKHSVPDNSNFCNNCGWNFNYHKEKKEYRRRYEVKEFKNCSYHCIREWLIENANQIEIISAKGNMRFEVGGFFITTYNWYFQYLTIKYYPNTKGHKYNIVHSFNRNGLFNLYNATLPVDRDINAALQYSKNIILDFYRDSHLPGGAWTYSRAVIFEYK